MEMAAPTLSSIVSNLVRIIPSGYVHALAHDDGSHDADSEEDAGAVLVGERRGDGVWDADADADADEIGDVCRRGEWERVVLSSGGTMSARRRCVRWRRVGRWRRVRRDFEGRVSMDTGGGTKPNPSSSSSS